MHRALPVANKACANRARSRQHEMHRQRVRKARPCVDTTVPETSNLDHLRNNLKREQLLEERYHAIDKENRILLQKMCDVMKEPSYRTSRPRSGPPSLNRDARKTELMRITQDNHAIMRRIQQAQPVYNHIALEDSYKKSYSYLKNSSEFPVVLKRKPRAVSTLAAFDVARPETGRGGAVAEVGEAEEDLKYVLKEGRRIGERYYLVEMATDGRTLAVSAYDGERETTLELLMNERNHRSLYRETNGEYALIADRLRVEGSQLLINAEVSPLGPGAGAALDPLTGRRPKSAG